MKLIHCADIHLGSRLDSSLPGGKAIQRRSEIRATFSRMVDYALERNIPGILLCGDLFDSDRPLKTDKEFFYSLVKSNPELTFFYLRGNHDCRQSYSEEDIPNLKTFSETFAAYILGDAAISGIEVTGENALSFYSAVAPVPGKKNILMLHGEAASAPGENRVCLASLRGRGIDYLALGHIHSYGGGVLEDPVLWRYSGCLEGRGYDETGEKGFVVLDTEHLDSPEFIPFSSRVIHELKIDLTGTASSYEACRRVLESPLPGERDLLHVTLTGQISYDNETLAADVRSCLAPRVWSLRVKDETLRRFDPAQLAGEISLRGEFLRTVLASAYTPQEQQKIIDLGLRALSGREV